MQHLRHSFDPPTHPPRPSILSICLSGLIATFFLGCSQKTESPDKPISTSPPNVVAAESASQPVASNAPATPPAAGTQETLEDRLAAAKKQQEETNRREQLALESDQKAQTWRAQFKRLLGERDSAIQNLIDSLMNELNTQQSQVATARDRSREDRLAKDRETFFNNPLALPTSPEVRQAALEYARARLALEKRFDEDFARLVKEMPSGGESGLIMKPDQTLAAVQGAVERLQAFLDQPADTTSVGAVASTQPGASPPDGSPSAAAQPPAESHSLTTAPGQDSATTSTKDPNWKVTVDAPKSFKVPAPKEIKIEVSEGEISPLRMLYSTGGAGSLALGNASGAVDRFAVFSLKNGKRLGVVQGLNHEVHGTDMRSPAVSANGKYFASVDSIKNAIVIWDLSRNKSAASFANPDSSVGLIFAGNSRLVAIEFGDSQKAHVLDLSKKPDPQPMPLAAEPEGSHGKAAASPGGKYLAIVDRESSDTIRVYDLIQREVAAVCKVPRLIQDIDPVIGAIAFSWDGKELAAFTTQATPNGSLSQGIICWDQATGEISFNQEVGQPAYSTGNRGMLTFVGAEPLQWFPDRKGWLLGHRFVIDRATMTMLADVESPTGTHGYLANKILDDRHVLSLVTDVELRALSVPRTPAEVKGAKSP